MNTINVTKLTIKKIILQYLKLISRYQFGLKGVFAKNESGYRLNAIKKLIKYKLYTNASKNNR